MYPFTLISSQFGKCGYKEDDWQIIRHITNDKEFLEALKEGYLTEANNRNDYPICSLPIQRVYKSGIQFEETCGYDEIGGYEALDGSYVSGPIDRRYEKNDFDITVIEKSSDIFEQFKKWKSKIQTLIPRIRDRVKHHKEQDYELKMLHSLANKYNYKLIKE